VRRELGPWIFGSVCVGAAVSANTAVEFWLCAILATFALLAGIVSLEGDKNKENHE
jgi:hypothetical protein